MTDTPHLYDLVSAVTGWTDGEIAPIVGLAKSTVQAQRTGRRRFYLTAVQRDALVKALRLYRDQVIEGVLEIEMLA